VARKEGALGGEVLAQTAVFAALGRRRCATIASQSVERWHSKGDVIFRKDSAAEGLLCWREAN
jgi:hypothetical protein